MNAYPVGQTIDLGPWELRDADGDLVVAADEACTLLLPDGTTTNPTVTTPSTGVYTALVTPAQLGLHSFEAILTLSDGSQAVNVGEFYVTATPFDPRPTDLTDVGAVRSFQQTPVGDSTQDAIIAALITRASAAISQYCDTVFTASEDTARDFIYRGGNRLDLAPFLARDITSVVIDPTGTPLTLASSAYSLRPLPAPDGIYRYLRLHSPTRPPGDTEQVVRVTGDWGYETVPPVVEHWTIVTVTEWLRRDVQAFSTTLNAATDIVERPEALPRAARAGLAHYRRVLAP